MKMQWHFSWSV